MPRKYPTRSVAVRPLLAILLITICAALVAACGSSGSGGGSGGGSSDSGGSGTGPATVSTTSVSGYGTVLATPNGDPLFVFTGDPKNGSKCTGACAHQWPPLTVSGKPSAGSGTQAGLLSAFKRDDGRMQVLYNGHAVYTHSGGSATAVSAAGTAAGGGVWYLISPAGKPITHTTQGNY